MTVCIEREMALTEPEFLRLLPKAVSPYSWVASPDGLQVMLDAGHACISICGANALELGSLSLPMLRVSLMFKGMDQASIREFMVRFDRAYHRGGG